MIDHTTQLSLLDYQLSAIVLLDEQLAFIYANSAAEQFFQHSKQRLYQLNWSEAVTHHSFELERLRLSLESGVGLIDNEATIVICEHPHLVELTATRITVNKQYRLLIELRPIDQQRRISQEIHQHAQNQAAKELVRGLAHEIKNPLGGLRGAAQLLERELPSDDLKEFTRIIIEQADRLRNLVDRLLGPQRPGTKQIGNIHSVIERVLQLVSLDKPEQVRFLRDYDPSIPEFEMDAEQLEQALLNIVANAVQVLGTQGEIKLITRTAHQVTIHGQRCRLALELRVIDNGPGIPESIRDTLFYPMVSLREGGTGLGLSIAQNLVDQHKGRIECISWPGHTEFIIYIPLRR